MKNRMRKRAKFKNRITRRLALYYLLALIGFVVLFFVLFSVAYSLTHLVIWQWEDPFYSVLYFVKQYILVFIGVPLLLGWTCITYYFMGRPLRYLDEVISASEKLATDTEQQIILSEEMKEVQDELNQVRESALRNAQLAKEAEQRKNDLIVYLAHDLKTPLTSVIGYLTLLRDEEEISAQLQQKYLSISLEKAQRLEDLINEFFEITRFNLSNIELQYSQVSLTRLLEQLTFEFKPMLLEKNLDCRLNIASDMMIRCDSDKLQRVFDNLLRNALFYSYEDSCITINASREGDSTVITFSNKGDSIPQAKLERIFEQFYRLDSSRSTNSGGAGLGLAIARQIVELHGGSICATSQGEYVSFIVSLPSL